MKRLVALLVCTAIAASGCASTRAQRVQTVPTQDTPQETATASVFAEFARSLPPGTHVRAQVSDRPTVKGALLKVSTTSIFVQQRKRYAEPPVEVRFADMVTMEVDDGRPGNVGRSIAAGAAAGAGAAAATFLILLAIFSD